MSWKDLQPMNTDKEQRPRSTGLFSTAPLTPEGRENLRKVMRAYDEGGREAAKEVFLKRAAETRERRAKEE